MQVMAVGYHEFDLAVTEERFVAQELVHLAMVEPGENMVDCQYNGVDFPLPVSFAMLPSFSVAYVNHLVW